MEVVEREPETGRGESAREAGSATGRGGTASGPHGAMGGPRDRGGARIRRAAEFPWEFRHLTRILRGGIAALTTDPCLSSHATPLIALSPPRTNNVAATLIIRSCEAIRDERSLSWNGWCSRVSRDTDRQRQQPTAPLVTA